jgi:hypothetical protein
MQITYRYQSGKRVEAVLLAAGSDAMRVVVPGLCDTLELHKLDANWITEKGEPIEIDAIMAADADVAEFFRVIKQRTNAAGLALTFD